MTVHQTLKTAKIRLKDSPTPQLDAELLLCLVLKCEKSFLISHPEKKLRQEQNSLYNYFIHERQQGKPLAYITNNKEFYGREFFVDERVMIPRPETEEMLEDALEFIKNIKIISPPFKGEMSNEEKTEGVISPIIIDLGTGSGAIAITLALELPDKQIIGLEISKDALEVAKINHKKYPCKNLTFLESDLLSELPKALKTLKVPKAPIAILANLPYIGTETNHFVSEETDKYEPHLALYGGPDGLELYRKTWKQLQTTNYQLQTMYMEIGFSQAEKIEKEAQKAFPDYKIEIKDDLAGLPRTAIISRPN